MKSAGKMIESYSQNSSQFCGIEQIWAAPYINELIWTVAYTSNTLHIIEILLMDDT